ncbi:MAG: hypothetical protein M3Z31_18155 [Pseudomonadota bacterium]|nr:hypothetical protein [Pseudomonadota bacterium]
MYHVSRARLLALPIIWAVMMALLAVGLLSAPGPEQYSQFELGACLVTLILLPFIAITWHSRLAVSPEGITHHQWAYAVRSSWSNVSALSLRPNAQALLLSEPGTHSPLLRVSGKLLSLMSVSPGLGGDVESLSDGRLILLAPFMAHWTRGPLKDDIHRWAPHLLDANGNPK